MVLQDGQFRFVFSPMDFEASNHFYRSGLGLPVDHEWDYGSGDRGVVFQAASGIVELLGLRPGSEYVKPQGIQMAIQVENADACFRLAQERGLKVVQEPVTFPWGHRVLRLQDPDGVIVSLYAVVQA